MTENDQNYLYGSLDNAYKQARREFGAQRGAERTSRLVEIINKVISISTQATSDEIRVERGTHLDENTITIPAVSLAFDGLIESGETVVTKVTNWLPRGSRVVNKVQLLFQVRFQKTDFVRLKDQEPQSRPGPITIEGKLIDNEGLEADFPVANFLVDKETGEYKLFYNFGSEIPASSDDFSEVEKIVNFFEGRDKSETENKVYTLKEIALVVTQARYEITGIESSAYDPKKYPDSTIEARLTGAQQKAKRRAGDNWGQPHSGGPIEIEYDFEHVNLILNAFADTAKRSKGLDYNAIGINEAVIKRARELLYGDQSNS